MVRCVKPRWWPVLTLAEKAGACWAGLLPPPARFSACRIETLLASSTRRTVVWEDDEASWPFGAAHTVTMAAGSSWKTPTAAMIRGRPLAASEHSKRLSCLPGRWRHQQGHDLWRSGRREDAFRSEMPNCVPLMNHVSDQEK